MIRSDRRAGLAPYTRMRPVPNVSGSIICVHSPINYDIKLSIGEQQERWYASVTKDTYNYVNDESDLIFKTTYRCRLSGIEEDKSNQILLSTVLEDIKSVLASSNSEVVCKLGDIDIYNRLLVDIVITIGDEKVDLKDYLLSKYPTAYKKYTCLRERF